MVIDYIDKLNKINHKIMIDGVIYDDYLSYKKRRQKRKLMQWYENHVQKVNGGAA